MRHLRRRPLIGALIVAALLAVFVVGGYGMYLASEAGRLPWQVDPTRIPITPFADIPGFNAAPPTPTVAPVSLAPHLVGMVARG
jgi:hypothetical protein